MRILTAALCLALLVASRPVLAQQDQPLEVVFPPAPDSRDPRFDYFVRLLELALVRSTPEHGPFRMRASSIYMVHSRALFSLARGAMGINVLWTASSPDRELQLLPIRIPLTRGLDGYRVFLVRNDAMGRFDRVNSLDDLKSLTLCQSRDSIDMPIMAAAGLKTRDAAPLEELLRLVDAGQCDGLPRAAFEAGADLTAYGNRFPGLVVERRLALRFPVPVYFFVGPRDDALAARIKDGLEAAIQDGAFDALLKSHPAMAGAFTAAGLDQRRILDLPNPGLPAMTPLADARLWYRPPGDGSNWPKP